MNPTRYGYGSEKTFAAATRAAPGGPAPTRQVPWAALAILVAALVPAGAGAQEERPALPAPVPIEGSEADRLENLGLTDPGPGASGAANSAGDGVVDPGDEVPPGDAAAPDEAATEEVGGGTTGTGATDDDWGDDDWGDVEALDEAGDEVMEDYDHQSTWYGDAFPQFISHINLMTARVTRPFSLVFLVTHRTGSPIRQNPFDDWLGLDAGSLKVLLGARYGVWDGLDVGFVRLNGTVESFDTYEFDARYQFLEQDDYFVDLALRVGGTWFHAPTADALKPFGQILIDRVFWNRLMVSLGVMIHGDSSGPEKAVSDRDWSMAGSVAADVRILEWLAFSAEVSFTFAGYGAKYPAFTFGPKLITNRHTFAIVVSNTQHVTADGIVANTPREPEDLILGFTITREFNF